MRVSGYALDHSSICFGEIGVAFEEIHVAEHVSNDHLVLYGTVCFEQEAVRGVCVDYYFVDSGKAKVVHRLHPMIGFSKRPVRVPARQCIRADLVHHGREQVILEADPPRRLSYTWNTFSPELAQAIGWSDEYLARIAAESRSRVSFEIEPEEDDTVRLTVIHEGFEEGSAMLQSISGGWPRVLANLKTLLESDEAEPLWACK